MKIQIKGCAALNYHPLVLPWYLGELEQDGYSPFKEGSTLKVEDVGNEYYYELTQDEFCKHYGIKWLGGGYIAKDDTVIK